MTTLQIERGQDAGLSSSGTGHPK